jgi:hypothetical protein
LYFFSSKKIEQDILEFCPGKIEKIKIFHPKNWQFSHSFIFFETPGDARWAVQNLNGSSLCGGVVRVEYPKKEAK